MTSFLSPLDISDYYCSFSALSAIGILFLTSVLWSTSWAIYNLYFHPLRSYPGPIFARATDLFFSFFELRGDLHVKTKEWHDKYGEVVRIAPNSLSYNSGQAWDEICGHRTANHKYLFDKDQNFFVPNPNGHYNIVGANGEKHRRLRRLLGHAFSERALKSQEACLQSYVDLMITQLRKRASSGNDVVNMVHWFNFTTFDIIGDLSFGESFALLEDGISKRYLSSIFGTLEFLVHTRVAKRFVPPSLWKDYIFQHLAPKQYRDDRMYQYQLSKDKMARRVANDTEKHDFVYHMLKGSREAIGPEGLTFEEMVTQSGLLLVAGSETTATLLSGMLFYLLRNPSTLTRLMNEIRTSFTSESDINIQTASQLHYMHAVLEESLRMYPPVPNILPRLAPEPGVVICGKFVPAGTTVGLHHWSCYRSARNFVEPDSFLPERWLEDKDPRFANDDKSAFHPFSHGPRNCLGKNLAYAELRLIVSKFFWNFDVELQPESLDWSNQASNTIWKKKPLYVRLLPRKVA